MSDIRNRLWPIALAVFVASAVLGLAHSDAGWDGTWVLQVIARMHAGDVLYRDVFAGVPPLTFALGYATTAVLGVQMAVLKVLVAGVMAVSWLAAARLLRRCTASSRFDMPLAIAMIACALPEIASLYQPLANMCLLLAIDAASAAVIERDRVRHVWLAGGWCGLAFLAKQTIGVYAGLASVALLLALSPRPRLDQRLLRSMATIFAAAVVAVGLGVAPIVWSGGWPSFLDYAVLSKGTYVTVAGVPYVEELAAFGRALISFAPGGAVSAAKSLALIVPVLSIVAAAALWPRRRAHLEAFGIGLIVCVAELAGLYPRADVAHVIPVVPGLLVSMFLAWHVWTVDATARGLAWLREFSTVVVAASVAVRFAAAGAAVAGHDRAGSSLPHVRGLLMPRMQIEEATRDAPRIHDVAAGRPLFLLVPNAGFYYLISGVTNPTPFDYPLKPAFGRTGEADTIARLQRGDLTRLCMKRVTGLMAPDELQKYVDTQMKQGEDLGVCTIYQNK